MNKLVVTLSSSPKTKSSYPTPVPSSRIDLSNFDQPRELTLSIRARVEARVELIKRVAHQVEPRPAVLLNRHIEGLLSKGIGRLRFGFRFGS